MKLHERPNAVSVGFTKTKTSINTLGEIGMSNKSLSYCPGWKKGPLFLIAGVMASILLMSVGSGLCDDGLGYTDTPRLPNSPWRVHDRNRPQPPIVEPGPNVGQQPQSPPSDAVVLFDGNDLSGWEGGDAKGIEDGCINILKTGQMQTKRQFGDCQLHVEWATPKTPENNLNWGNSGVFLLGKYELQILESHDSKIYADGIAGALYGQTPPLDNAARKPGEWQTFDIAFTAPQFDGGKLVKPAYFTVYWNGVLVHNHTTSLGPMKYREVATYDSQETTGPILLQQHGSAVLFRNIWVRDLKPEQSQPIKEKK
jgi:hypothetical protein